MAVIRIPTPLRRYTDGERIVSVAAENVAAAIAELDRRFPGLGERLVDGEGQVHRFITIFVGEEDVRFRQGLATPLDESSEVSIIPAMAGGGRDDHPERGAAARREAARRDCRAQLQVPRPRCPDDLGRGV